MEAVEQLAQVFGPPAHIIIRIIHIPHIQTHGGLGHQLHQADSAGARDRSWIKVRLSFDDGSDQCGMELVLRRVPTNDWFEFSLGQGGVESAGFDLNFSIARV
jgi:hypothetical protein